MLSNIGPSVMEKKTSVCDFCKRPPVGPGLRPGSVYPEADSYCYMNIRPAFSALLIIALGTVAWLVVFPLNQYIITAGLLAFLCQPLHDRLIPRIGTMGSALVLTVAAALVTVVPLVVLSVLVLMTAQEFAAGFDRSEAIEELGLVLNQYVDFEQQFGASFEDVANNTIQGLVAPVSDRLIAEAAGVVTTGLEVTLGLLVLVFLMYYFLKDGDRLFRWVRAVTPLEQSMIDEFFEETRQVTWAVLKSHVFVALVEGVAAGVGLWVLGVPNAVFWTGVMVVFSVLPAIGVWIIWAPATLYLFLTDGLLSAAVLLVYGLTVLALIDDVLRAYLVNQDTGLHPAVVLVGVVGGIYLLGILGVFLGPVLLAVFKAGVAVFSREYGPEGKSDEPSADAGPTAPTAQSRPHARPQSQPQPQPDPEDD